MKTKIVKVENETTKQQHSNKLLYAYHLHLINFGKNIIINNKYFLFQFSFFYKSKFQTSNKVPETTDGNIHTSFILTKRNNGGQKKLLICFSCSSLENNVKVGFLFNIF